MIRIKKNILVLSILLFSFISISVSAVENDNFNEDRSWSSKSVKVESTKWKNDIEKWNRASEEWGGKRDEMHRKYYHNKYNDRAKYCNNNAECWEETLFNIEYKADNIYLEYDKDSCGINGNDLWECTNHGQFINFKKNGIVFESTNYGQFLKYKDGLKKIISTNYGQFITIEDLDGNTIESTNHGQFLRNDSVNDNGFESTNYGQFYSNE